jgi:hypothetical protein
MKVAKVGGSPETLASDVDCPGPIAVDSANVYWSDRDGIHRVPNGGGTPTMISTSGLARGLVVDATSVYWTVDNTVMKVDK